MQLTVLIPLGRSDFLPSVLAVDIPVPPISYSYGSVSATTSTGPKFSGLHGEEPIVISSDASKIFASTSTTTAGPKFSGIHRQEAMDIPFVASPTITTFATSAITAAAKFSGIRDDDIPDLGTAIGGALDPSLSLNSAARATVTPLPGDGLWTIIFQNDAGKALQTQHTKNAEAGNPDLVGGMPPPGQLASGARSSVNVPTNYAGRIAVAAAGKIINGWESLVEFSLLKQGGTFGIGDIDVSYVDGFTFPIMCTCQGVELSGCNVNLWTQGKQCLEENGQGACKNPHRNWKDAPTAHDWFKKCENLAYTYSNNNQANSNGECQSGTVVCTIKPGKP